MAVTHNLPPKKGNAKVTLQLVVATGRVKVMKVATMEDECIADVQPDTSMVKERDMMRCRVACAGR